MKKADSELLVELGKIRALDLAYWLITRHAYAKISVANPGYFQEVEKLLFVAREIATAACVLRSLRAHWAFTKLITERHNRILRHAKGRKLPC